MPRTSERAAPGRNALVADTADIRHAARRLRWFTASFGQQVAMLAAETGVRYASDPKKLARVFVAWLRAFESYRRWADLDRRDFTHFAAGLMLRELVRENPLSVERLPSDADPANPAYYWPEGYVYVAYCLNVIEAVLAQEFDARLDPSADLDDVSFWWTFRENTREDPGWAIAFMDRFSGQEPSWDAPELFFARRRVKAAVAAEAAAGRLG